MKRHPYRYRTHEPAQVPLTVSVRCTAIGCTRRGEPIREVGSPARWGGLATCQAHAGRRLWAELTFHKPRTVVGADLAAALTLWERRHQADPDGFRDPDTPEEYGRGAAIALLAFLDELAS